MSSAVHQTFVALVLTLSVPALAHAEEWIFFDPHPVHPAAGGGFCEGAGAHVHDYAPIDPSEFVRRDGLWFFVGDPVTWGYRGTVYRFDGGHEVEGSSGFAACSRAGVHHHLYAPVVIVGPDRAVYVTPVVAPFWWDDRPRLRVQTRRPHAFPVDVRVVRPTPPAIGPPASRPHGARALDSSRRSPAPPPPAARGSHR
jgi:hypothetical protein